MMKMRERALFSLALTGLMIAFTSCDSSNDLPDRDYRLIWSDEFDGPAGNPPDVSNWNYETGTGDGGWGNMELQYYTDRTENVALDGEGNLVITAIEESFEGSPFTSARLTTQGKIEIKYGRIEARLKTPFSQGLWPAFWLLGTDIDEVSWPQCGEIDVMELRGQEPRKIAGSIHGPGYSAGEAISRNYTLEEGRFDTEFHVFAIEWGEDFIDFFVDDRLYQRLDKESIPSGTEWVYDKEFYLLLNVAVGGTYVGSPSENSRFPQTMIVDYVRVYQ